MEHVRSFTHVLPKIYAWAQENGYPLEFIFGKKQKSIYHLLDGADCEIDVKFPKTNLGAFNFLKSTNTTICDYNNEPVQRENGVNIGICMDNSIKWNKLGINMMKWIKNSGFEDAFVIIIGKGDIIDTELQELKELGHQVPRLTISELQFNRFKE